MLKSQIVIGGEYRARVSGKIVTVRVDDITSGKRYNWDNRETTRYSVTNLNTGRVLTFHSAARFTALPTSKTRPAKVKLPTADDVMSAEDKTVLQVGEAIENAIENLGNAPTVIVAPAVTPQLRHQLTREELGLAMPSAARVVDAEAPKSVFSNGFASNLVKAIQETVPHIEGRALAGTGKTTTAVQGMMYAKGLPTTVTPSEQQAEIWSAIKSGKTGSIRFTAFNSSIASELKDRLESTGLKERGCEASTTHGLGFSAVLKAFPQLRGRKVNDQRTLRLLGEEMNEDGWEFRRKNPLLVSAVEELTSLCKQTLTDTDPESLSRIASHYDVEMTGVSRDTCYGLVAKMIDASVDPSRGGMIDFDDMCWLPVVRKLPIYKTDLLIIDESQDMNKARQELCKSAGHRILFIGDKNQAIYGFAGASDKSMDDMRDSLSVMGGCKTLPLTVTRRCGKAIVEEARKIVPDFEAHESNPEGIVCEDHYTTFKREGQRVERDWDKCYAGKVRPRDMVLCRVNAPLVSQCFKFLRRNVTANIQGRNVGAGLSSLIKKLKADSVKDLIVKLGDWLENEMSTESKKKFPSESKLINVQDKYDCIMCFTEGLATVDQVLAKIDTIFTDDRKSDCVRLSSIHKAKGLESNNVFFLMPEGASCPHPMAKLAWQKQQENNCWYVAVTRARESLTFVY